MDETALRSLASNPAATPTQRQAALDALRDFGPDYRQLENFLASPIGEPRPREWKDDERLRELLDWIWTPWMELSVPESMDTERVRAVLADVLVSPMNCPCLKFHARKLIEFLDEDVRIRNGGEWTYKRHREFLDSYELQSEDQSQ